MKEKENKKASKVKIIIGVVGLLLFLSGALLGYFVGIKMESSKNKELMSLKGKETTTKSGFDWESPYKYIDVDIEKLVSEPKQKNDINSNIQILKVFKVKSGISGERSDLHILAKNNNSVAVDVDLYLNYYDSEGYSVDSSSGSMFMVGPGKEFVIDITPSVRKDKEVKTYKLLYNGEKEKSYHHYVSIADKDFVVVDSMDKISVSVTNKTGKSIDYGINAALILYQGNDVVYVDNIHMGPSDLSKIANGATVSGDVSKYRFEGIKYDKYKVVESAAYYKDENW